MQKNGIASAPLAELMRRFSVAQTGNHREPRILSISVDICKPTDAINEALLNCPSHDCVKFALRVFQLWVRFFVLHQAESYEEAQNVFGSQPQRFPTAVILSIADNERELKVWLDQPRGISANQVTDKEYRPFMAAHALNMNPQLIRELRDGIFGAYHEITGRNELQSLREINGAAFYVDEL